jgi:hypothetical protein
MRNYWTCSKFADWLRGTPKLKVGSSKEWNLWRKDSKEKHPIRFWLAEEGLDYIQDFIMWPFDKLYQIKYRLVNRFSTKTHALTSNLPRGEWHEFEERILHCLFDELVNFVEIEQAWHHALWDEKARKKYKSPWYAFGWFRTRTWRCPAAGLDYLEWASKLKFDDEWMTQDDPRYGQPTPQAELARETLVLYYWWKEVRPTRVDPYDASNWSEICERRRKKNPDSWVFDVEDETDEERQEVRESLDLTNKLETEYAQEDEDMLIRLIKIRQGLWT